MPWKHCGRKAIVRIIFTDRSIHQETRKTSGSAETMQYPFIISGSWRRRSPFWLWVPADQQDLVSGGNRLERVANVSNYEIYIDRLDEMMERKKNGFFGKNRWR